MKKLIVLLVMCMGLTLTACGSDEPEVNNDNNQQTQVEDNQDNQKEDEVIDDGYERNEEGVVCLTTEQTTEFVTTVEITLDNYLDYFGDYEEPYHKEETNNFGETTIVDRVEHHFGLKDDTNLMAIQDVAFRFKGFKKYYYSDSWSVVKDDEGNSVDAYKEELYPGDGQKHIAYYLMDGTLDHEYTKETKLDYIEGEIGSTGNITLDSDWTIHCAEYECVAAVGKLLYLNIPDELWTKTEDGKELIFLYSTDGWEWGLIKGEKDGYVQDHFEEFIIQE